MKRGLPFWLLRLESARCPKCKRDNVWRRGNARERCRWCEASMVDWVRMTRLVNDLAGAFGNFGEAVRATTSALAAYGTALGPTVWTVDVETATHDDLRAGETCTSASRIQVLAPNEVEAKLVACQMAAKDGRMPTKATVVDPEQEREEAREELRSVSTLRNPLSHAVRVRRLEP